MVKYGIKIYCRVKPVKGGQAGLVEVDEEGQDGPLVSFTVPRELADGYINNKREVYSFRFDRVFGQQAKQDHVFEHVAQSVIENVLVGFNGTIFAYGQTGSGKTYSITGGAERYADRGIIPRTLSYIFEYFEKNSEAVYTTHISYLEIYNENGYDLLDPKHEASKLEDLPKVTLMEDSDGNIHLKNLSLHQANNEEEALNWLFLGDTNRMIAETPMNQASTRSHCIFTIHISTRDPGSAVIRRAKLHLVDLAGSERVGKTNVGGTQLTEAKYINLSLHYLEQVIVALSEKSRSHIPYRNSMMTAVLRDSLGGNCMTSMIATCSAEKRNIDESISTCRFAQRVALIKNDAILNEEVDPKLMIARLKKEIQQLKAELSLARGGGEYMDELSEEDMQKLRTMVSTYIEDTDPESALDVGGDMKKIHFSFKLLKDHVLERRAVNSSVKGLPRTNSAPAADVDSSYLANQTETKKLKDLIQQRDNEINILVGMLKKEKARRQETRAHSQESPGLGANSLSSGNLVRSDSSTQGFHRPSSDTAQYREHTVAKNDQDSSGRSSSVDRYQEAAVAGMSVGRKEAFEIFRRDYPDNQLIEENKTTLKQRYAEAKSLGEQVNHSRQRINKLKAQIEQHRIRQSVQGSSGASDNDHVEQELRDAIEHEKTRYKEAFTRLRSLKTEIEHLQHLLEKSKVKLQKDFEIWWIEQASQASNQAIPHARSAWKTPPLSPIRPVDKTLAPRPPSASHRKNLVAAPSQESVGFSSVSSAHDLGTSDRMANGLHNNQQTDKPNARPEFGGIPLTGDSRADADIMAFVRARQNLLNRGKR